MISGGIWAFLGVIYGRPFVKIWPARLTPLIAYSMDAFRRHFDGGRKKFRFTTLMFYVMRGITYSGLKSFRTLISRLRHSRLAGRRALMRWGMALIYSLRRQRRAPRYLFYHTAHDAH